MSSVENLYFYLFVRKDLPVADQACQIAHAAAEAGKLFQIPDHCFLVLLHVENKSELLAVAERIAKHDIRLHMNVEPDDDMLETALCTEAITKAQRGFLRGYKLWAV